jgi:hypothetical protein
MPGTLKSFAIPTSPAWCAFAWVNDPLPRCRAHGGRLIACMTRQGLD